MDRYIEMISDLKLKLFTVDSHEKIITWTSEAKAVFKKLLSNIIRDKELCSVIKSAIKQCEELLTADCTRKDITETMTIICNLISEKEKKKSQAMQMFEMLYDIDEALAKKALLDLKKSINN